MDGWTPAEVDFFEGRTHDAFLRPVIVMCRIDFGTTDALRKYIMYVYIYIFVHVCIKHIIHTAATAPSITEIASHKGTHGHYYTHENVT